MNFALIIFLLCVVTGLLWAADRWSWKKRRPEGAPRPLWLEYTAGFFSSDLCGLHAAQLRRGAL